MKKDASQGELLRRVHRDRLRPLRVVEQLDNSAVFADSPVEIKQSYAVSDRETGELFLVLIFRCLSERPLAALDVRLLFYDGGRIPLPARKLEFRYGWETATKRTSGGQKDGKQENVIACGEEFGEGIFLPLPEDYFRRLQIELVGAEYSDGSYETLELPAGGSARRFADMSSALRTSYAHVNPFRQAEETHPIRVLPQAGKNVWLCCCGHKNPAAVPLCEVCGREKDWQLKTLSEEGLRQVRREKDADPNTRILYDKSAYVQPEKFTGEEEKLRKAAAGKRAWGRLDAEERKRRRRFRRIPLWIGLVALLAWALIHYEDILSFVMFLIHWI